MFESLIDFITTWLDNYFCYDFMIAFYPTELDLIPNPSCVYSIVYDCINLLLSSFLCNKLIFLYVVPKYAFKASD